MLCLNMQMFHYLIEYALICIIFKNRNMNIGWSEVQNSCLMLLTYIRSKICRIVKQFWNASVTLVGMEKRQEA